MRGKKREERMENSEEKGMGRRQKKRRVTGWEEE